MEFKGTKGKWLVNRMDDTFIQNDKGEIVTVMHHTGVIKYETIPYNALLISKSTELLEALQITLELLYQCECPKELHETYANIFMNYNNLIKEATEL